MKILRLFDSLKFVRAIFVAVACAFVFAGAHAAILPAGYTELEYLEGTGEQYIELSFGFEPTDMIWTKFAVQGQANDKYIVAPKVWNSNNNRFGMGVHLAYYAVGYGNQQTSTTILQPSINNNNQFHEWVYSGYVFSIPELNTSKDVSNITFGTTTSNIRLFYGYQGGTAGKISYYKHIKANGTGVELIPARRNSDGVLGMYDVMDSNPATAFHTNAGTGAFIAGEYKIKIATTKYNEAEFAPVQTNLETARTVINNLITQMQTNAVNVSKLAVEKQTRPNVDCPAGKNCLLVTDPTGAENWYEIAGAGDVETAPTIPNYFSFTADVTDYVTNGQHFQFGLSPAGNFTIDWGDGSEPESIITSTPGMNVYHHEYTSAGEYTIRITGRATEYEESYPVISFSDYGDPSTIKAIDGSLGAIFPTLGNGAEQQPNFSYTFAYTQITSIPPHLFDGVTGAAEYMFSSTFEYTQITSIPAGLFSGVTGAADGMFENTFYNCQNLTGYIPESTFAGLIQNNSPDASVFMDSMFYYSTGLATACPQNTTEVSTPYKSKYWETRNGNYAVMCRPN